MIGIAILAEASAWIGGMFEGERCERCGCTDVLEPFRVEVSFGGRKIVRKSRLCRKCMKRAEAEISCLPDDGWMH
ncbi:hypothetical protein [Maridesulfovibrio salexigens]|uniref:Uncharacterized protein n=1 Tax=Maridesulfovibrio salexigens (strain ATCC 14822 / DSM 2638 / NCIMB 8403 / VKM B-1763) TaxID=526222 RepID=C6BXA4_MARSD|nr:hypothetical protein [Maridesulfovibrio salexigens]ACS80410.1 hypothetical protein Desal_2354 [Maridesulfovibrio salexigens DSM 2638]